MRTLFMLTISCIALTGAVPANAASTPFLEADTGAGACGGSISCAMSDTDTPTNPTASTVAVANDMSTLPDGSYADGHATVTFGAMHLYADAFRASGSDAQASAMGRTKDYFSAGSFTPGQETAIFAITGSLTGNSGFGQYAFGLLNWQIYDTTNNKELAGGQWDSSNAMPQTTLNEAFTVPTGHGYEIDELFEAAAYSSFGVVDIADYSQTLDTYISTPGGGTAVGASGHAYFVPIVAGGVPEPGSWAMMIAGFGIVGGLARRRQAGPSSLARLGARAQLC